jgi:hypothetical protein
VQNVMVVVKLHRPCSCHLRLTASKTTEAHTQEQDETRHQPTLRRDQCVTLACFSNTSRSLI